MNKALPEVIANILTYYGAEVEKTKDGSLDIVAPQEVSNILNMPEYARLIFSYNEKADDAIYASYDSEFFRSIKNLFAGKGRFSIAAIETAIPNIEKLSRVVSDRIILNNAVFRQDRTEVKNISYLLIYFKYEALSDEKHEGILPLLINELTLSTMQIEHNIADLKDIEGELKDIERHNINDVLHAAYLSVNQMIKETVKDFRKSLERRLNRDVKRVYEYYEALKVEVKNAIEKKSETDDKLLNKVNAIEMEQRLKVQDLVSKYTLNIHVKPLSAVRIETDAPVFWINIKRRLAVRQFPVIYNPIDRQFDFLPCESCYNPQGSYYICDDKLHIVCARCFEPCTECGKQYCRACHNNICPKCNKGNNNNK
ncbi:MAG: hypothetical protein HY754_04570 [Nitrospirae bacterium]|nr:hypothetical protein [Nitrospirota bacterium]